MTFTSRLSLGGAVSCAFLLVSSPSLAQTAPQQTAPQQAPPAQAPAATPSDAELRSFARAVIDLTEIQQDMAPRIQAAPEQERPALQQQANERMATAVQRHDLDPQEFNAISAAVEQNPQLAQQVRSYVQDEVSGR